MPEKQISELMPEQMAQLAILYTRIAAGIEKKEPGFEKTGFEKTGPAWEKADEYISAMVEKDPNEAFNLALALIFLPVSDKPDQEKTNEWLRVSGITILGYDQITPLVGNYLQNGKKRFDLRVFLADNLSQDLSGFKSTKDFANPQGVTTVQSIYIALNLGRTAGLMSQDLYRLGSSRRDDQDVVTSAGILTRDGCEYFNKYWQPS